MIFLLFLTALATSAASATHGSGRVTKGLVMAAHAAVLSLGGFLIYGAIALPAAVCCSLIYWFGFRTSKQAKAQLHAENTIDNADRIDKLRVKARQAYYVPVWGTVSVSIVLALLAQQWLLAVLFLPLYGTPWISQFVLTHVHYTSALGMRVGFNHGKFWDVRRCVEATTGLLLSGVCVGALYVTMCEFLGALW